MSNSTAPGESSSETPLTPGEEVGTSPPTQEASSSSSSPPTPPSDLSNPTPPPEDDTTTSTESPPPSSVSNLSPPPTSASPPPSPTQSPPHSPPPATETAPSSPPPVSTLPPPGFENPNPSSPPPSSIPFPPPSGSSHSPSSPAPPSSETPPIDGSPPPSFIPLSPFPAGTHPSPQEPLTPPSQFLPPHPGEFYPPPLPEGSLPSPPSQVLKPSPLSPPVDNTSPLIPRSPTRTNGTSPTSSTSTTPTSSSSFSSSTNHGSNLLPPTASPSNSAKSYAIGGVVAGVLIVALIAIFFGRRKKKRSEVYATQYMPPNSYSVKSDGYYLHTSGPADAFYTQPQLSIHGMGNSYGSQRGNMYHQGTPDSNAMGGTKSGFTYEEVMEMTNGFSRANIIGEGGFGCVFKGWLPDGKMVAVKQLKKGSGQGEREFQAEVEIISRVHHRYLVSLVGYCIFESQRLLIYEFVPNNTLEYHLHGKGVPVLEWDKRMKIALGAARGLAYLHEDCHPKIIHRDIKSANILLDDAFEAQVADFGLAKLTDDTNTHVSTRVMGTFGYMAPEYASSGKLTDRSDVFSFGVMLLELVTGRKPVDPSQPLGDESLVEWARPLLNHALETGNFSELVDERLGKSYVESEMFRMIEAAAACVRHSAQKRPRMMQVARALDCESETSDLSNGVKYGQSTVYDSGQYNQDITRFRRMAFGSGNSKEFDLSSGEYTTSREVTSGLTNSWKSGEVSSSESETQAMNGTTERRFKF